MPPWCESADLSELFRAYLSKQETQRMVSDHSLKIYEITCILIARPSGHPVESRGKQRTPDSRTPKDSAGLQDRMESRSPIYTKY